MPVLRQRRNHFARQACQRLPERFTWDMDMSKVNVVKGRSLDQLDEDIHELNALALPAERIGFHGEKNP